MCKLNERGMLRRSFVPPEAVRDLRALTRTRSRLAQDQARHQARVEKILEDGLLKISVVISDLFGASGRRFLDALVAGERSPAALAALGDPRLKAIPAAAGGGADRPVPRHPRHRDRGAPAADRRDQRRDHPLDEQIGQQLAAVPGTAPACSACGLIGGGHAPDCDDLGILLLGLADRLDEITGIGAVNGRAIIAELGTEPLPVPHPRARRRMGPADPPQPGSPGKQPGPAAPARATRTCAARLGQAVDDRGQNRYPARRDVPADRPQARQAESHRRGRPRHLRDRLDPDLRPLRPVQELGPDYYRPRSPARQTRDKIREIERLNPGKKVILADDDAA